MAHHRGTLMKGTFPPLMVVGCMLAAGCATPSPPNSTARDARIARGPWSEVPAVEMPTGDTSIPIDLLRDVAEALLRRPGAKVCDPVTKRPIVGLSTEYCSTVYVAGDRESLSWRVTEPIQGSHNSCRPLFVVQDGDHPASQVWVVGYVHNHPCGAPPSSRDIRVWPTDAFDPSMAMAEVRLIPGNPAPAVYRDTGIEMASALVAASPDGTRLFLRYFPTGEIQQWSAAKARWVSLARCSPGEEGRPPQCDEPLRLLRE
ncbi:hypothetical protein [Archangium sp.]|uniref:hypothetical protein n=1 Tax=Archangium sp. TaxID=1872627 RepID=UPI0038999DDD